jgi:hypothetical protein
LILERIYEEIDWRVPEPKEIREIDKVAEIYEDIDNNEEVLVTGNNDLLLPEMEAEKEEEKYKTIRRRRSMKGEYLTRDYKKGLDNRKIRAEKI